ncbi:MAG TPA: hypothetical protein VF954_02345, partial [Acidimicrobiales bacterium]
EHWWGQPVEIHDAPTHHGRLSAALRWHGDRPALLWQLVPAPWRDAEPGRLRAPALDPNWASSEPRGDVLLAPARGASGQRHAARPPGGPLA